MGRGFNNSRAQHPQLSVREQLSKGNRLIGDKPCHVSNRFIVSLSIYPTVSGNNSTNHSIHRFIGSIAKHEIKHQLLWGVKLTNSLFITFNAGR